VSVPKVVVDVQELVQGLLPVQKQVLVTITAILDILGMEWLAWLQQKVVSLNFFK
jgi:hypothetical protein